MKKYSLVVICIVMILSLVGCSNEETKNVEIDYGSSELYTKKDMDKAVELIKGEFRTWEGCELHSLSYSSDEYNNEKNIAWMNELGKRNSDNEVFTECMMFESSFHSPKEGGGAWEADTEYTWSWWFARGESGKWKLMTWGY